LQSSAALSCAAAVHGPVQFAIIIRGIRLSAHVSQKIVPSPFWDRHPTIPRNTLAVPPAKPTHCPKRHLDGSAILYRFQMLCCTMHCQYGGTPHIAPSQASPLGFRHPAGGGPIHGHRQHPQTIGRDKSPTYRSGDILADRGRDTQTSLTSIITILAHPLRGFARR